MIIFKLILVRFKQNLKSGCSNFIFRGKTKKKNYIIKKKKKKKASSGGSFEPPGLAIGPPLLLGILNIITCSSSIYRMPSLKKMEADYIHENPRSILESWF